MINWPVGVIPNRHTIRYEKLIEHAKNRTFSEDEYGEIHHVIPRCFGGKDTEDNIVKLYAREHYIAHLLLWKMDMLPKMHNKMSMALHVMVNGSGNKKQDRSYLIPARIYEQSRKAYVKAIKEHFAEHGGTFKGRKHKPESIQKIIEANARTKHIRSAKLSGKLNGMYGKKHPEEVKQIIKENVRKSLEDPAVKEKMSAAMMDRWKDEEYRKHMINIRHTSEGWLNRDWKAIAKKSAAGRRANGTNKRSDESKKKMSETRKRKLASGEITPWNKGISFYGSTNNNSKIWEIIKPNGDVDVITGTLRDYCKANKIGYDSLRDLANGKKGKNKLYLLGYKARIIPKA